MLINNYYNLIRAMTNAKIMYMGKWHLGNSEFGDVG